MGDKKVIVKAIINTHLKNAIQGSLPLNVLNQIAESIDLLYRYDKDETNNNQD